MPTLRCVARRGSTTVSANRVMFPINDVRGDCIAFGGRAVGKGEPKYLNTGDTPIFHKSEVLFALDKAKARMTSTGDAIVVEGYTDVIALHESGFDRCRLPRWEPRLHVSTFVFCPIMRSRASSTCSTATRQVSARPTARLPVHRFVPSPRKRAFHALICARWHSR